MHTHARAHTCTHARPSKHTPYKPTACVTLWRFYTGYGTGGKRDTTRAKEWEERVAGLLDQLEASARDGVAVAQLSMGQLLAGGLGRVEQDEKEAVKYYQLAAEQGDAEAQNALGFCFDYGKGVTQDRVKAVRWYKLAAEQGHAKAQYSVGNCFYKGEGVRVAQDIAEAVRWCKFAAEQGHADAQNALGLCFDKGEGVARTGQGGSGEVV